MTSRILVALHNKLVEAPVKRVGRASAETQLVASLQCELMRLGYILDQEAFHALTNTSTEYVSNLYSELLKHAHELKGANVKYTPFWVNFPNDVMDMSDLELYMAAILHYWSNGTWTPPQELKAREFKYEHKNFIVLRLAKPGWDEQVLRNLSTFTKPLDPTSIEDLKFLVKNNPTFEFTNVSVKETMATIVANGGRLQARTMSDVLRIAVAMSGGDVSLSKLPADADERKEMHFKKFKRSERRMLLQMIENLTYVDPGDMQTHLGRWIRLGEILHPGEYAKQFPRTFAAFNAIRNQKHVKVRTFAGSVDIAFNSSVMEGIETLATRPGEFARKLDWMLRTYDSHSCEILRTFGSLIQKVSTKVLFEMRDHFDGRLTVQPRVVMIKGAGSSSRVLEDLEPLSKAVVFELQSIIQADLVRRASMLPKMNKIFIDPELQNMPIPYAMQSSSEGTATMIRGTKFKLSESTNTIRAFTHWYDANGSIDVDLGAAFLDENFKLRGEVTFYELSNRKIEAYHSGDVRHRRGHNAEYVDFDLESSKKAGVRYVVFFVYNYNGSPMATVPEATFGIMERSAPKSNEIFDPATCPQAIKITCKSTMTVPILIDLEKNQYVWLDMESDGRHFRDVDYSALKAKLTMVLGNVKYNVRDLLKLHVYARNGELVDTPAEADEVFMIDDFNTDYVKLAPYMAI